MSWLSQVRHEIEGSFEPLACECVISADASLSVRIYDRESGRVDLMVIGIALDQVKTQHDVLSLISELRDELNSVGMNPLDVAPSSQA
ncbi:DUF1652 domain-containing protein [Pseudomonas sp. ICMP 561]|uniref:DUF1652 domain-containing protein n=1 Tax=Pseudomonas sp. ICMP 561 TaxID=1718918 RepID=UPI000C08AA94|nr:DUF1652 domain-containing protein [Pseudomonas sp. ICMP 561]PHN20658.1 hypothetical protein AO242_18810 [Pseudomonas sp. ICMP 561]